MVKTCIHEGCQKRACYNIKNNKPKMCLDHKTDEMVNVSHKICEETDCKVRANYNLISEKKLFIVKYTRKKI